MEMTSRARWRAALRHQPVDRLPFWPKITSAYLDLQPAPYSGWCLNRAHEFIGSDHHVRLGNCVRDVRSATSCQVVKSDGRIHTTWHTPLGQMTSVTSWDEGSRSWHPTEFPVKTVDDIRRMALWYQDARPEIDRTALVAVQESVQAVGENGFCTTNIGQSPLMHWVEWLAGIENSHLLLADHPREAETLFEAMHQYNLRKTDLVVESTPCEGVFFIENTSTTLISPQQYRRHCRSHIVEYGERVRAGAKFFILHMCGHLRHLLADLVELPADGFEAFTTPPLGNTTLAQGRASCPDKCLIGGSNALTWIQPVKEIAGELERGLDELPHHRGLVVTSGGVMPPGCSVDTIRQVAKFLRQYRIRC
jgi:hypothetical protein